MSKYKFKKIVHTSLSFLFLFLFVQHVDAATLSIDGSNSNIKIGDIITATIYVNAGGESINNVEGQVSASNFEIQSITNSGSILNMWVEQPTFSKTEANFNGGVLNPGYSGSSGRIVTLSLKAIREGVGTLTFDSASVRANDGLGTDVLKSKSGLSVNISSNVAPVVPTPPEVFVPVSEPVVEVKKETKVNSVLNAPTIYSSATPDPDSWYNIDKTTFTWDIPANTTAIKTLMGSYPDSEPTVLYDTVIKSKTISDIGDGVWYFHLKYKTADGWSKTGHKKIKIDTTSPESITIDKKILDTGMIEATVSAFDKTSYITRFLISVPGEQDVEINTVSKEGTATYVFPSKYQGIKEVKIKAFDSAHNIHEETFTIDFPKVSVPEIFSYPVEIKKESHFSVSGTSKYSNSRAELKIVLHDGTIKTYQTQTKQDGSFVFEVDSIKEQGELSATVLIFVGESQVPVSSENIYINVKGITFLQSAQRLLDVLLVVVPIIMLLAALIGTVYLVIKRVVSESSRERSVRIRKIEKETTELLNALRDLIVEDIHLVGADKSIKDIDEAETIVLKNILKDFKDVEKQISNRLKKGKVNKKRINVEEE